MQAQQLKYYIENEKLYKIESFVVDSAYKKSEYLDGLKVVEFEKIRNMYEPEDFEIVLSFGYKNMMDNRKNKFQLCKELGYNCFTYISNDARVYTDNIGEGTIVYPNVTIAPNTKIGIGNFFEINSTIAHNTIIGNFNFFAPSVTVSGATKIGDNCFFGIGSVVFNKLEISNYSLIGAGVVMNHDTKEYEAYKISEPIKLKNTSKKYI
jgi:sugar O-acyltransferase (sialic acid O-acetyltransferase NeuD family)